MDKSYGEEYLTEEEKRLRYANLFRMWLQAKAQEQPGGVPVQQYKDTPAYFMKPEDMATAFNAFTPYDLYLHPNKQPIQSDYPTIAYNQQGSPDMLGIPRGTTLMSSEPSLWQGIKSWQQISEQYPSNFPQQLMPQAVYEHEAAHTLDPRLRDPSQYNKGYLQRNNLEGGVYNREQPAMQGEDSYWGAIFSALRERQK